MEKLSLLEKEFWPWHPPEGALVRITRDFTSDAGPPKGVYEVAALGVCSCNNDIHINTPGLSVDDLWPLRFKDYLIIWERV